MRNSLSCENSFEARHIIESSQAFHPLGHVLRLQEVGFEFVASLSKLNLNVLKKISEVDEMFLLFFWENSSVSAQMTFLLNSATTKLQIAGSITKLRWNLPKAKIRWGRKKLLIKYSKHFHSIEFDVYISFMSIWELFAHISIRYQIYSREISFFLGSINI